MLIESLTLESLCGGEGSQRRSDPKSETPFVNKSVSEAMRHAHRRALRKFFKFVGMRHPAEVATIESCSSEIGRVPKEECREVAFNLSVVRSFFEYLKAAGAVPLNPASTKLVSPPKLPSEPSGRALSAKAVRYLLSGPDRGKAEGARDYTLMLERLPRGRVVAVEVS